MTHSSAQITTGTGAPVGGSGRALLFKFGPVISAVRSAIGGLPGLTVASGSNITVYGSGFSGTGTQLTANGAALATSNLSDQQITAFLPAGYNGLVRLKVSNANGQHTVNIMTAAAAPLPSISLSADQAAFSYTLAGSVPAPQTVNLTNAGGGTLTWTATSGSSWLTVSPNSGAGAGMLTLGINHVGLTAQTYNGAITVTASGARNSPQTISVKLTVNAASPSISLSTTKASFSYSLGGSTPASQTVNVTNSGGGTLAWSAVSGSAWLTVSPISGTGSGTLTLGINPAGLTAQTYNGAITVTASGATNSPQTISVSLTISAAAAPPVVVSAVVNAASWTGGTVAPGELIVIGSTMLGPSTGVSGTVDVSTGTMVSQLAGTTVLFNGVAAPLLYTSATQVNAIVPYEVTGCTQTTLQVQYQGALSSSKTLPAQPQRRGFLRLTPRVPDLPPPPIKTAPSTARRHRPPRDHT